MKNVKRWLFAWLPVLVWCGGIFYFSNQPNLNAGLTPTADFIIAKIAHIAEYFILALLVYRALKMSDIMREILKRAYLAGFLSVLYAASDEFHQHFVMGRTPAIRDIFIDFFGIVLAVLFVKYTSQVLTKKQRRK